MEKYYLFFPHETDQEVDGVKYHITGCTLKTLCGIDTTEKLLGYETNGKPITLDWYNQNIATTNIVCKRCAKKLLKILLKDKK